MGRQFLSRRLTRPKMKTLAVFLGLVAAALAGPVEEPQPEQMWNHDISMSQLLSGAPLPDGDQVQVQEIQENCYPEHITVELQLVSPITTWKGITLHTKAINDYWKTINQIESTQSPIFAASSDPISSPTRSFSGNLRSLETAVLCTES